MGSSKIREKHSQGSGGKKNPEVAGETLVPGMEDIALIDNSSLELFRDIVEAESLKTQIERIRTLVKTVTAEKFQIVSTVLVRWYFQCSGPLKKVLSNCVNSVKDQDLQSLISAELRVQVLGLTRGPHLAPNLLAGLDNFPLCEAAVLAERDSLVGLVVTQLEQEVDMLTGGGEVSPVERASLTCQAGSSLRLLVHLVRSWETWSDLLTSVSSLAARIVQQSELAQDLRANAGHVLVVVLRLEKEETLLHYLEDLSTGHQTRDSMFSYDNCGSVLALLHGLVSTVRPESSASLLPRLLSCYLTVSQTDRSSPSVLGCSRGLQTWASRLQERYPAFSLVESFRLLKYFHALKGPVLYCP